MNRSESFMFVWRNYLHTVIAVLTFLFIVGYVFIKSSVYLIVLNSLFFGTFISVSVTYGYYFIYTIFVKAEYTREKQFILSTGLLWFSMLLAITYSYKYRSVKPDLEIPVDWQILLSRYIVIIAAIMQVFTPDMGQSLYYGVHRKVLFGGFAFGLAVAGYTLAISISPAFASIVGL